MSQQDATQAIIIASLYREAIRQGQALWFRVSSSSMNPLLRIDDTVYVEPVSPGEIQCGEIAAFETPAGLVIHRIICRQRRATVTHLLQMGDAGPLASWIEEKAIVGRVITARRGPMQLDLQHPLARWCGTITAQLRYQYYIKRNSLFLGIGLRKVSRLAIRASHGCIQAVCASSVHSNK